jgi:hypothetical protein
VALSESSAVSSTFSYSSATIFSGGTSGLASVIWLGNVLADSSSLAIVSYVFLANGNSTFV